MELLNDVSQNSNEHRYLESLIESIKHFYYVPQTKMNNFLNTNICNVFYRESLNSCFAKSFEDIWQILFAKG